MKNLNLINLFCKDNLLNYTLFNTATSKVILADLVVRDTFKKLAQACTGFVVSYTLAAGAVAPLAVGAVFSLWLIDRMAKRILFEKVWKDIALNAISLHRFESAVRIISKAQQLSKIPKEDFWEFKHVSLIHLAIEAAVADLKERGSEKGALFAAWLIQQNIPHHTIVADQTAVELLHQKLQDNQNLLGKKAIKVLVHGIKQKDAGYSKERLLKKVNHQLLDIIEKSSFDEIQKFIQGCLDSPLLDLDINFIQTAFDPNIKHSENKLIIRIFLKTLRNLSQDPNGPKFIEWLVDKGCLTTKYPSATWLDLFEYSRYVENVAADHPDLKDIRQKLIDKDDNFSTEMLFKGVLKNLFSFDTSAIQENTSILENHGINGLRRASFISLLGLSYKQQLDSSMIPSDDATFLSNHFRSPDFATASQQDIEEYWHRFAYAISLTKNEEPVHVASIQLYREFLLLGNQGYGSASTPGLSIFKVDLNKVQHIQDTILQENALSPDAFNYTLVQDADGKMIYEIKLADQKFDNCPWKSFKLRCLSELIVAYTYPLLQKISQPNPSNQDLIEFENLVAVCKQFKKRIADGIQLDIVKQYLEMHIPTYSQPIDELLVQFIYDQCKGTRRQNIADLIASQNFSWLKP